MTDVKVREEIRAGLLPDNGREGVQSFSELITPERARLMLRKKVKNRRISPALVERYARDMRGGRWNPAAAAPIYLDTRGFLLNGEHRLLACIASGTGFSSEVRRNVPREALLDIDTGRARTFTDYLAIVGEPDPPRLSSALSWVHRYDNDALLSTRRHTGSRSEMLEFLEKNPGIRDSLKLGGHLATQRLLGLSPGSATAIHYIGARVDAADIDAFFAQAGDDTGLDDGDPILALQRWCRTANASRDRPLPVFYMAMTIKVANAWRAGLPLPRVIWRAFGPSREPFPRLWEGADDD